MTEASDTRACPRCAETIKAAATLCRFCGSELRAEGTSAPRMAPPPSAPVPTKRSILPALGIGVLILAGAGLGLQRLGASANSTMDRIAEEARRNPVPSGEHCLDPSIGGLHADLWLQVKQSLHDPDSMRDMVMTIAPVDANQQHKIRFQFRAKNAFGALRIQNVEAYVMAMRCVLVRWSLV